MNRFLDSLVIYSHNFTFRGRKIHPYFLFADSSIIISIVFSYLFTLHFKEVSFTTFISVLIGQYILYEFYLRLKKILFKISARTFLQDFIVFILPSYLLGMWMANQNMLASLDLFGLFLALIIGIVRIGCFLGGCCHGIPCRLGVVYPKHLVTKHEKVRKYKPTAFYNLRVFPLQLLESFICLSLFVVLLYRLFLINHRDGSTLPLFFIFYCSIRFFTEFLKLDRGTKNIGFFSQAQIASLLIIGVCCFFLKAVIKA